MKNRRANRRTTLHTKVDAIITYSDTLKDARCCCVSDVSSQGMFLKTDTVLEKDSYVNLKICPEELPEKSLWVQGLVVRTATTGMAIEFTYTDKDDIPSLLAHYPYG